MAPRAATSPRQKLPVPPPPQGIGPLSAAALDDVAVQPDARRGRGAVTNMSGRFEKEKRSLIDDGWGSADAEPAPLKTTVQVDATRTIIARNDSPDIPFDRSINPYRGCEHGCIYCFARPSHAYLGLSPGLDFEARLFAKPEAAALLRKELAKPGYRCRTMALGTNTDPYQPIEGDWRITRSILEVLNEHNHPVGIVTKSARITRDIDILADMARRNLVRVHISVTTLDRGLARAMEPRASTPERRLEAISLLAEAGVTVGVNLAPVIPGLNDHEMERILRRAYEAGARDASYIVLRLPLELKDLWQDWLREHRPDAAGRVMKLLREMRGGRDYDPAWGKRMTGEGTFAELIGTRFRLSAKRNGYRERKAPLDSSQFKAPVLPSAQLSLF